MTFRFFTFFYFLLILFGSDVCWAQDWILIDTLNSEERKELNQIYVDRKENFYKTLPTVADRNLNSKIRAVFDASFKDLEIKISNNEVVYHSPLNDYLKSLVESIKVANPDIEVDFSILVSRINQANASIRGDGTLVLNNYLFNTLNSEDQLVYILCHEIAHHSLNHVYKSVRRYAETSTSQDIKNKTKDLKKQKYQRRQRAENLLLDIAYTSSADQRSKEIAADSLGFVYYTRLKRDPLEVIHALSLLRDSDQEQDSLTKQDYRDIFRSFSLNIKDSWFVMERFDQYNYQKYTRFNTDSLRTHPNCDSRINKLVKDAPELSLTEVLVAEKKNSTDEFNAWKKSVLYQNMYNEYAAKHYGNSLYEALKLYSREPNDLTREYIGLNFKALLAAKKKYELNKYVSQVNIMQYTTSYNQFSSFIFNLSLSDLESICKIF